LPGEVEGNRLKAEAVHGPIAGLGAALLLAGLEVGKSVTALYAPAVEETGDPEAAAEFLASVRPLVPHERIEPAALLKQTADIERRLREDRERAAREASRIEGEINRSYL
jgi:predicted ATP-grasp superfamily ATP-dependent carboligase